MWLLLDMAGFRSIKTEPFSVSLLQYCLTLAKSNERTVLVSGCTSQAISLKLRQHVLTSFVSCRTAGDENINLWQPGLEDLALLATLESEYDAVLAFAARDNTLFAGHQGGVIKVRQFQPLWTFRWEKTDRLPFVEKNRSGISTV